MNWHWMLMVVALALGLIPFAVAQEEEDGDPAAEDGSLEESEEAAPNEPVIVETPWGSIRGNEYDNVFNNGSFFAFLGIPYALPPIGERRFMPPVPVEPWEGILDGTEEKSRCCQVDGMSQTAIGDEDCLHLAVFTPKHPQVAKEKPLPVLFFIHGGGYHYGTNSMEQASPDYYMTQDIIIVWMHYRLGIFGFLSFNDELLPGNAGLKDQLLALKWVNKNIASFGGDPGRVTLCGYSAGAASVHHHLLAPPSRGLFHGAIISSGSALTPWAIVRNPREHAEIMSEVYNCSTKGNLELLHCLQAADAKQLTIAQYNAVPVEQTEPGTFFIFVPSVEPKHKDAMLPDEPLNQLLNGDFADVPIIIGVEELEAGGIEAGLTMTMIPLKFRLKFLSMVKNINMLLSRSKPYVGSKRMADAALAYYLKNEKPSLNNTHQLSELVSDLAFNLAMFDSLTLHVRHKKSPAYQYYFTHDSSYSIVKQGMFLPTTVPTHSDLFGYMFYVPDNGDDTTHPGFITSQRIVRIHANFAATGNPTPDNALGITWPSYNLQSKEYLNIGEKLKVERDLLHDRVEFWRIQREKENFVL